MNQIVSHDDILQCLIASEAVSKKNPIDFIHNEKNINKNGMTLNKIKALVLSKKDFIIHYMICTCPDKRIIVSFKGTDCSNKNDVITNLFISGNNFDEIEGKCHSGFFLRSRLMPLDFFSRKIKEGFTLLFTGHSLGAAVGAFVALKLLVQEKKKSASHVNRIMYIGFGCPLICDDVFARFVNKSFKRNFHFFVNENDIIPKLLVDDDDHEPPANLIKENHAKKKLKTEKNIVKEMKKDGEKDKFIIKKGLNEKTQRSLEKNDYTENKREKIIELKEKELFYSTTNVLGKTFNSDFKENSSENLEFNRKVENFNLFLESLYNNSNQINQPIDANVQVKLKMTDDENNLKVIETQKKTLEKQNQTIDQPLDEKHKDEAIEILKKLQETEKNSYQFREKLDEVLSAAQNKDTLLNSQRRSSIWQRLTLKNAKSAPNDIIKSGTNPTQRTKQKRTLTKIFSTTSQSSCQSSQTETKSTVSSTRSKKSLVNSLLRKFPRGKAFGYYYHMVTEETPDGPTLLSKHYDTEKPEFINFYYQFTSNDQYKLSYIKFYKNYHAINSYKLNFLNLMSNLEMENSFFISNYNDCLIPTNISTDLYKIICFKNKLSSVNLILELDGHLPNIDLVYDAQLVIPELNLRVKLYESPLVRHDYENKSSSVVFNFLINKIKLKNISEVKYSEIIVFSHFNQSVVKFSNNVYENAQAGFSCYRNVLNNVELNKKPIQEEIKNEIKDQTFDSFESQIKMMIENIPEQLEIQDNGQFNEVYTEHFVTYL